MNRGGYGQKYPLHDSLEVAIELMNGHHLRFDGVVSYCWPIEGLSHDLLLIIEGWILLCICCLVS